MVVVVVLLSSSRIILRIDMRAASCHDGALEEVEVVGLPRPRQM